MTPLPVLLGDVWGAILAYVFFYPVLMSVLWMIGGIVFYLRFERRPHRIFSQPPLRDEYPLIAVLVPCYNEEENVEETVEALMELKYPNYEVIAINDGSTDRTGELLNALAARFPKLRVIHQVAITTRPPTTNGTNNSNTEMSNDNVVTASNTSSTVNPGTSAIDRTKFTTLACSTSTPLGCPVEPDV